VQEDAVDGAVVSPMLELTACRPARLHRPGIEQGQATKPIGDRRNWKDGGVDLANMPLQALLEVSPMNAMP
jgi:hypothetical protein